MRRTLDTGMRFVFALAFALAAQAVRADDDVAHGEKKFEECAACHKLQRGEDSVGPSLYGVFGRQAGTLTDFRFSPAMKRSGITWYAKTLDTFLTDPQKVVPANRMPYAGLADTKDRADLIAYLQKTFK